MRDGLRRRTSASELGCEASLTVVGERGSGVLEGSAVTCRIPEEEVAVARRRTPFDVHAP